MANKDYPKREEQASQQSHQTIAAPSAEDTSKLMGKLVELVGTQNQLLQKQVQNQGPKPLDKSVAAAMGLFNDIAAGLEFKPLSNLPDLKNAQAVSSTEIRLEWEWTDNDKYTVESFKIWRCEGHDCQDFVEINKRLPNERTYNDTGLTTEKTYRYVVSAFTSRDERFSQIAHAKTH